MPEGTTVVTILPDSIRNYMTKHLMDEWMYERELLPPPVLEQNEEWYNRPVSDLPLKKVFRNYVNSYASGRSLKSLENLVYGKNRVQFFTLLNQSEYSILN